MSRVHLICSGSGGVVDVPGSDSREGVSLLVYGHHHGGDNQVFLLHSDGLVSSALDPALVVGREGEGVVLTRRREEASWSLQSVTGGQIIRLQSSPGLVMTDRDGQLVLEEEREESPDQCWRLVEVSGELEAAARPATSCHLHYPLPSQVEDCSAWSLSCTVTVAASSPSTYFCVVGWGPAGYSGIQEVSTSRRVAIFSMWNDGHHRVELVDRGESVDIDTFGGD